MSAPKSRANPAGPPSPSDSFYDLSDEEEGEYNTIAHSRTGRGVKLLHSKSKVYVHPTPSAKDNIPGFIALIQHKPLQAPKDPSPASPASPTSPSTKITSPSSFLLAWVPESSLGQEDLTSYVKVDMSDQESPPKQTYLVPPLPTSVDHQTLSIGTYAFAIPLSNIYSLLIRPPSLGWWYGSLVINTRSGSSFPALFFHDADCDSTILQKKKRARESFDPFGEDGLFWGGDEVLRWLKRHIHVERSGAEPNVYLIDLSDQDRIGFGNTLTNAEPETSNSKERKTPGQKQPIQGQSGPGMDPLTKVLKETRWRFLEQLSKVTTFTRRTAQDIAENPKLPPQVRRLLHNPEVQTLQEEFDSARLYLARWAMGIAEQSEREKNQRIWTAKDVLQMENSSVGDFEILDMEAGRLSLGGNQKRRPVDIMEWTSFFDPQTGKLNVTVDEVKERIFHGGLDPEDGVRKEAWLFLLGVYDWSSDREERTAVLNAKRDDFIRLKSAWWERTIEGDAQTQEEEDWWREQKGRIEKDVHRTDRHIPLFAGEDIPHPDLSSPFYVAGGNGTNVHLEQLKDMLLTYLEYDHPSSPSNSSSASSSSANRSRTKPNANPNPQNLGYVQGMSDLLAPIYAVMQDDAIAFWCFVCFMRRMARNFVRDQSGMRAQLTTLDQLVQLLDPKLYLHLQSADSTNFFFFFRMLLVWYKREFEWPDILRLWEGLWTDYLSSQFHLFIAVAILEKHRDVIMQHLKQFDEVLKYINELSGSIDLPSTLVRAEGLFRRFEKTVEAVDRKGHFPAPGGSGRVASSSSSTAVGVDATATASSTSPSTAATKAAAYSSDSNRPPASKSGAVAAAAATTTNNTNNTNKKVPGGIERKDSGAVITPELRVLLSRKVLMG